MDLNKELLKLEELLKGSGLIMEKYKKKINNLEREKMEMKTVYGPLKPKTESCKTQEINSQKLDFTSKKTPVSQVEIKRFQEAIQNILAEQKNFQRELENMRRSKQMLANETVVLQNSLSRLKHDFQTRSYADRDMQILKREVQRVWHQKRLSDEQRKRNEGELIEKEERLKVLEKQMKHSTENFNKATMTLNVYKIILREQQQQIHHLHEEIQKQSTIIEKQSHQLQNCLNELESSKTEQKQILLNLKIKMKEENHLKNLLSEKGQENMNLKMESFILQEKLSESQHQQELAKTKLKWNDKYWNYYQSRLEAQDNELRSMKISQECLWINDQCLTFGSRTDLVIQTMDKQIEKINPNVDDHLIPNLPSLIPASSLDKLSYSTSSPAQHEHKIKIAALEMELQKKSALLDFQMKYNKELEYHINLLHQIFLGDRKSVV